MYKQVKEPGLFGKRPRTVLRMFCENCEKPIRFSSAADGRHLCEKCYKKLRGETDVSATDRY